MTAPPSRLDSQAGRDGLAYRLTWLAAGLFAVIPHLRVLHVIARLDSLPGSRRDFAWIYMAGRSWLSGQSPYNLASLAQLRLGQNWGGPPPLFWGPSDVLLPFVYPPHWVVVAVPAALLSFRVACTIWDVLSYAAFLGVTAICCRLTLRRDPAFSRPLLLVGVGLCALNGGTTWSLADCQMDLIPLLAVSGAIVVAARPNSTGLLALLSFVALLKPQIGVAPLVYLFLRQGSKGVVLGALMAGVVSVAAMLPSGLAVFPAQLLESGRVHAIQPFNAPASFFGVAVLLDRLSPGNWALTASSLLGVAFAAVLARAEPFASAEPMNDPLWRLAVLMSINLAFFPQHGYGFVAYAPIIILALQLRPRWLAGAVLFMALLASRTKQIPLLGGHPLAAPATCIGVVVGLLVAVQRAARLGRGPERFGP